MNETPLQQSWPAPGVARPIVIIGGGGIVRDGHIPAYRKAKLPIAGVFDLDPVQAAARAKEAGNGARAFSSLEEGLAVPNAVFDCATPPGVHLKVLEQLPDGATVLLQKPMGQNFEMAKAIVALCESKKLIAAVNFQLRFSPDMLAIRDLIQRGDIGKLVDIDVRLNLATPWQLFPFLEEEERVEIQVHSVHYLDLIRSFAGDPKGVYARTVKHPDFEKLNSTKSSIILDYGDFLRVNLSLNHTFPFQGSEEDAIIQIQGTEGAAFTRLGLLLNYPEGRSGHLEVFRSGATDWETIPLSGDWFPDAFIGTMHNLQRFASGEDEALISSVQDALRTMAVVEACYESNAQGGTPLPK